MRKEYLTEKLLGEFLIERFTNIVSSPTLIFDGKRYKPDFVIEDLKLMVEFDGPRHYTQPSTCIRDITRTKIFQEHGYDVISIPYFIQLNTAAIKILFRKVLNKMKSHDSFNDFPHGFIAPKVIMPAEYCSLGLFRFNLEINKRLQFFKNDIIQSLDDKIESGIPELCVYPLSSLELDFDFIDMYPIICQMKNGKETLEQQFGITEEMMKTCSLIST